MALVVLLAAGACTQEGATSSTADPATTDELASPTTDQTGSTGSEDSGSEEDELPDKTSEDDASEDPESPDASQQDSTEAPEDSQNAASNSGPSTCLTNGADVLVLDFGTGETDPFTGVAALSDSVAAVSGVRLDPGDPEAVTFLVNASSLGSSEDGAGAVEQQLWYGGEGISINGTFFSEVPCDDVPDRRDEALRNLVGDNHPPLPDPSTTIRTCYIHADEILILDLDPAYMVYTGARTNREAIEAFAGRITGQTQDGETELTVSSSPVGSAEEDGDPIVNQQQWLRSDYRAEILVGNQMFAEIDSCDNLGDRVAELDNLVDAYPAIIE